jgi:hypothetical protein
MSSPITRRGLMLAGAATATMPTLSIARKAEVVFNDYHLNTERFITRMRQVLAA